MRDVLEKYIDKYIDAQDNLHDLQKLASDARGFSKQAITLLRAGDFEDASYKLEKAKAGLQNISKKIEEKSENILLSYGFYREAVEEYLEALALAVFLGVLDREKFPPSVSFGVEEMISGICDFTGELVRCAINLAGKDRDFVVEEIEKYKVEVESISGALSRVGFQGKLRQKYDEAERNLIKLENIRHYNVLIG